MAASVAVCRELIVKVAGKVLFSEFRRSAFYVNLTLVERVEEGNREAIENRA